MAVDVSKHLDRAQRYLEKNKIEDAIEAYQSILRDLPGHVDSLQALGDLYARTMHADRAAGYYAQVFDRLFETHEENRALAVYARTLKPLQQPPERMARYALLLQKQNRAEEAIEQFALASELFLARGKDEPALDCLDRIAQLDPDNASRQFAVGELAERLDKMHIAARAFLRAGQLSEAAGHSEPALELLARAHTLMPEERGPALLYAQACLRRDDAATAAQTLEPFSTGDLDTAFLTTFGEALMRIGQLDRARKTFERLPPQQSATHVRLFELARQYLQAHQDEQAVSVLRKIQQDMVAARCEHDFTVQLDALADAFRASLPLAEFCAGAYAQLNREVKYFDALVRVFDLYLNGNNISGACEALEKLVDIDAYDSRNQQRMDRLAERADPEFLVRLRTRLSRAATHGSEPGTATPSGIAAPAIRAHNDDEQTLEDLLVQAEIFMQYSLHAKAIDRLQRIVELFPGEEQRNERLRNLCKLADWSPSGTALEEPGSPGVSVSRSPDGKENSAVRAPAASSDTASDSANTMRDLAKISEISQSLLRLTSPRAILSGSINEIGQYLHVTRCIAVIGPPGKPPQMATEFCAPGIEPAPGALLVRLLAQFERVSPDVLGGLPMEAAVAPVLRELGLETALAVILNDPDARSQAGMVIAGHATSHTWRPSETYFLQAVGDQMLLGFSHTRLRAMARNLGAADEKTGLLARSSYQDCLLNETQRAKSHGKPLALALLQIDNGPELLRQHGESQMETYVEQLARTLESAVRQTDLAVKYTSWGIAFILPDTPLAGAQVLAEKLRKCGSELQAPWDQSRLTLSASVAEAVKRLDYDSEDIVTELINRAEFGLQDAHQRGGDTVVALNIVGS
jgi:diguanylate cyclase (GGDEF)-like protein